MTEKQPGHTKTMAEIIKEFEDYCWDDKTTLEQLEVLLRSMQSSKNSYIYENKEKRKSIERVMRRRFGFDPLTITP